MDGQDTAGGALEPQQQAWRAAFERFAARHPERAAAADRFIEFVCRHADAAHRELAIGHLTGSAWLVSADGRRVLLTHHRKLGLWLQLGGHADGDADLARVALREAEEESGLTDLVVDAEIFDLDCHAIPARGAEPEHFHYDVRFVVRATGSERFTVGDESHALAWREIADVAADATMDASVRRMARTWLEANRSA
ncbi:MAG TPA: NUDIX hydrolase [Rudaea sp.]|nr:NUDIX hydrolase [Rudaea sp.]